MPTLNTSLPLAPFIAAALAMSAAGALAQTAGQAAPLPATPAASTAATPAAVLERAAKQLSAGRLVEARAALLDLLTSESRGITDADRKQAAALLSSANRRIKDADPREINIQKAELALAQGDVRTADLHAANVLSDPAADAAQQTRARALVDAAAARRAELAAVVPEMLAQAERDFAAGRYAEAKVAFAAVQRSGVELTEAQQLSLDEHQTRIVALERSGDKAFGAAGSAGALQPGTIVRREDQPAEQPPADVVELQPADAQPDTPPAEGDVIQQAMRIQAQADLAQANAAYAENRLNEAVVLFNRVLTEYRSFLTPEQLQQAQTNLTNAQVQMQAQVGPGGGVLEQFSDDVVLVRNQTLAEFNNQLQQARQALAAGNVDRAGELAAAARLTISSAATYFRESEFEELQSQVGAVQQEIEARRRAILQEEARRADEERRTAAEEAARRRTTERERQINELIGRARAYQAEMRYEEALQAVDQLLFLNPIDPAGLLLKDILTDIIFYRKFNAIQSQKHVGYAINSIENQEASIPPPGIINFPADWPSISFGRGETSAFAEPPENRAVLAELERRRIPSVQFTDNALEDVVEFVGAITQLNIDVDWASLQLAGVERETPVSLNLTNVTAKTLLDRVVEKASGPDGLTAVDWAINDGIVTIASEEAIRRNTTLLIYDISDLLIEVPDYDDVPEIDLASVLQAGQGGGGQSPFTEDEQEDDEDEELRREERMDDIVEIITQNIDFDGWLDNGGDTGKIQRLDRSLIITNTPKNHRAISGLLSKLREIRAMQINVETRFLLVNQDWFEQIGFDIDVIFNANNNQVRAGQALYPQITARDFFNGNGGYNGGLFSPSDADLNGDGTITGPGETLGGTGTAFGQRPRAWSPINVGQNSLGLASGIAPASDWASSILGASPALGIAGQFLDDIQVDFLIQATQADRRSIQLTAPRLTFTNGQIANIYVVTQQAFVSDLNPIVGESAVGFDPTIDTVSEGVTLLVEGTVTADRRYVTMNVDAGVSRIDQFAQQPVTAVAGGQLVDSSQTQSFIQLPQVTVTRVRTTVTVPDQGTLLLGGQRLVTEFEVETGVPVLSKLPILNRFFTNRIESKEEQTLLILIKPTILIMSEEEERNFPGLSDSLRSGMGG